MDVTTELTHQHPRGYKFPLLSRGEVLESLDQVGIDITEAELNEPIRHKDRVRAVLTELLKYYWSAPEDDDFRSVPACVNEARSSGAIDHPELHENSVVEAKIFRSLVSMMRKCGYHNFGLRDLGHPDSMRFRRQLSAVINFMKYQVDNHKKISEQMEQRVEIFEAYDEIVDKHQDSKNRLERAKHANCEKSEEIDKVEAECSEMEAEITKLNKIQSMTRQEGAELKKKSAELHNKIAEASIALRETQAEERKFTSQVIGDSGARIRSELADAQARCAAAKRSVEEREDVARRVRRGAEHAAEGAGYVERGAEALNIVGTNAEECGRVEKEVDVAGERALEAEAELRECEGEKAECEEQLHEIETQREEMSSRLKEEIQTADKDLNAAKQELGDVERERVEGTARLEEIEREVHAIEVEIKQDQQKADDEIAKRIESFHRWEKYVQEKENQRLESICH